MKLYHALAVLATPAFFAPAPVAATMPGSSAHSQDRAENEASADPNKLICKRDKVPGSRLAAKKVCMTAAEWERQRIEDRQLAEKVQTQRGSSGGN